MSTDATRRDFLRTVAIAGAGVTVAGVGGPWCSPVRAGTTSGPLKVLVLGGTGQTGPHLIRELLDRGHTVTMFTSHHEPGQKTGGSLRAHAAVHRAVARSPPVPLPLECRSRCATSPSRPPIADRCFKETCDGTLDVRVYGDWCERHAVLTCPSCPCVSNSRYPTAHSPQPTPSPLTDGALPSPSQQAAAACPRARTRAICLPADDLHSAGGRPDVQRRRRFLRSGAAISRLPPADAGCAPPRASSLTRGLSSSQVSACIPVFRWLSRMRVLFYCHFPDMVSGPRLRPACLQGAPQGTWERQTRDVWLAFDQKRNGVA